MSVPIQESGQKLSFLYSNEKITFERLPRRFATNRVLIKVHPDCRVVVTAPVSAKNDDVLSAVKKRGRWIYEKRRQFLEQMQYITPRQYISGESHYYLGRQHVLKVAEKPADTPQVKLLRGKLEISVREKIPERVKLVLHKWYRTRASEIFNKRLDMILEQALWVKVRPPIRIQSMQTQWGSCSPSGQLTLNPHLVKAPRECIDYVILHELCHIAEHNHSERFYRLMGQVMPSWKKTKARLDNMAVHIINDISS